MDEPRPVVTRFAPSPTGYLHLGHAYAALLAHDEARRADGRFLLRMEDIDVGRCRPEFADAIVEDLSWLGLTWDGPVVRQSQNQLHYARALEELARLDVVYPCFCTRKEILAEVERSHAAPHGHDGIIYPGTCRVLGREVWRARLAAGEPHALRLDSFRAIALAESRLGGPFTWHDRHAGNVVCDPSPLGDVVLARKDIPNSYHLSVTVDDNLQGVTLVTRGKDLFTATHIHRLLQALLGYEPPDYYHHRLITNDRGERLSKRDAAMTLREMRKSGVTPSDIRETLDLPG